MEIYQNTSGKSGVYAYEEDDDSITVYFIGGQEYKYTLDSVGGNRLGTLKELAANGSGLNSYINKNCKDDYEI